MERAGISPSRRLFVRGIYLPAIRAVKLERLAAASGARGRKEIRKRLTQLHQGKEFAESVSILGWGASCP
jgi:hypothetical protein